MKNRVFKTTSALGGALLLASSLAHAEIANDKVRIGVLSDLSGIYESGAGLGSVEAAKMAVEEFGGKINGKPIEVIAGDHQNKPDLGASIANRWYDVDKVDVITEVVNSAVAFAVLDITKQKNKTLLARRRGLRRLHRQGLRAEQQRALGLRHLRTRRRRWRDRVATRQEVVLHQRRLCIRCGARSRAAADAREERRRGCRRRQASARQRRDFSSFVLQAQAANPDVIALNSGGDDTVGALKAIREFGLKAKVMGFGLDSPSGGQGDGPADRAGRLQRQPMGASRR